MQYTYDIDIRLCIQKFPLHIHSRRRPNATPAELRQVASPLVAAHPTSTFICMLLSKRPHRGLAKTRYSFVVTVERLDFGSSEVRTARVTGRELLSKPTICA